MMRRATLEKVVAGLGLFSLGLGLLEALAPKQVAKAIGMEGKDERLRAFGLRELGAGIGLLAPVRSGPALWARAAGDVMDLAALREARPASRNQKIGLAIAVASVSAILVLDVVSAVQAQKKKV